MAAQVVKEGTRMPGYSVKVVAGTPQVILAGNAVEYDVSDTTGNTIGLWSYVSGTVPSGIALESNVRSTQTNQLPGAEYVTEYNRGGLVSFMYGNTGLVTVSIDSLGNPFDSSDNTFVVNKPIFATKDASLAVPENGNHQLCATTSGNVYQVGIVKKVVGTYSGGNLSVTFQPTI